MPQGAGPGMSEISPSTAAARRPAALAAAALVIVAILAAIVTLPPHGFADSTSSAFLLALATFVSEDLTCVAAGEFIRRGEINWFVAVFGCFFGIYTGDLLLWAVGRTIGPRILRWRWVSRRVDEGSVRELSAWFDRRAPIAVLAARFMPGMRLPVYLGAGMLRGSGARFALWTFVAALLWTPPVVLLVALAGQRFVEPFERYIGRGWLAVAVIAALGAALIRLTGSIACTKRRAKLIARVSRIWRWEFWPSWLFYAPLIPWIAWMSLRHRSFLTITVANPAIPLGGFVGESKYQILSSIKHLSIIETKLIPPGDIDSRVRAITDANFPLILKPDVGQRGAGVKLIRSDEQARDYLRHTPQAVIAQPFHPGPFEAGLFYVRIPGESHGRIFSITDKVFPELVGDGKSTLEQLIWSHPRFRMQARTFLERHADARQRVLSRDERFRLAIAGNHCQGTLFRDGAHLITPQLDRAIDDIARSFEGFYFGRFDVRYRDVDRFRAGEDLTVIELNGVTSESTNVYDPSWSIFRAYRTLFVQWTLLFAIGAANRARGVRPSKAGELLRAIVQHFRDEAPMSLAD
jgi:membrane protein DedA with SNARE-associated domain